MGVTLEMTMHPGWPKTDDQDQKRSVVNSRRLVIGIKEGTYRTDGQDRVFELAERKRRSSKRTAPRVTRQVAIRTSGVLEGAAIVRLGS